MRSGLLRLLYWSLAAAAVAFVAGIWFFLPGTSAKHIADLKHIPDLMTVGHSLQPTDPAVAPSPTFIVLRKMLPELARRAHPDDRAAMTTFYEERRGPLLWVTETGLSDKGRAVISEVRKADDWGLHSSDFSVPQARAQLAPSRSAGRSRARANQRLMVPMWQRSRPSPSELSPLGPPEALLGSDSNGIFR